jgi:hypothetical protein
MSEDLDGALASVEQMYVKGALTPDQYYQCLVTLAGSFLTKNHDAEQTLKLLNRCAPEYFEATIINQMANDAIFAASTAELVYTLEKLGLSDSIIYKTTVPPASA